MYSICRTQNRASAEKKAEIKLKYHREGLAGVHLSCNLYAEDSRYLKQMPEKLNQAPMDKADLHSPRWVGPWTFANILNLKFMTVLIPCTDGQWVHLWHYHLYLVSAPGKQK